MYFLVKDDAMSGDNIQKGDILVINKNNKRFSTKDIVLVEACCNKLVRRIIQSESAFCLIASNPNHNNVVCENVKIIGVVTNNLILS